MIRVKSNLDDYIRRFALPGTADFNALLAHIRSMYNVNHITIKYQDDDGDLVTISADTDLEEAISMTNSGGVFRVSVFKN